jgi:hypothetical protein
MSAFVEAQKTITDDRKLTSKKCLFCSGAKSLKPKQLTDLYEAMLNKSIEHATILKVLASWGVTTSMTTITNHRSGAQGYWEHMANLKKVVYGTEEE